MTRPTAVDVDVDVDDHVPPGSAPSLDETSARWLSSPRAMGAERDRAVTELPALLLLAARFATGRRAGTLAAHDRDDLAVQAADDALMHVLAKVDTFEGRSRFSAWACEPEVICEICFAQLDAYVDAEVLGQDADALVPGMRAHLAGCPARGDEHDSLRALVISQ